jgi:hypothetical protein
LNGPVLPLHTAVKKLRSWCIIDEHSMVRPSHIRPLASLCTGFPLLHAGEPSTAVAKYPELDGMFIVHETLGSGGFAKVSWRVGR